MAELDFDQIPAQEQMVDNWGQPTPWMQALWQRLTGQISTGINDVADAVQDAAEAANLAQDTADDLTLTVNYLGDLSAYLIYLINVLNSYQSTQVEQRIRHYIENSIRGAFRGHGEVTATTSGGGTPGYINIAHGKAAFPDTGTPKVQIKGTYPYCVNIASYDNSVIAVYVWDPATGVGASGVSVTLVWDAWFWDGYPAFGPPGLIVVDDPPAPP